MLHQLIIFNSLINSKKAFYAAGFSRRSCRIALPGDSVSYFAVSVIGVPHFEQYDEVGALRTLRIF